MSPSLVSLIDHIRSHAAFQELLRSVEKPRIAPFVKSKAKSIEEARSQWIFESGQLQQHNEWLRLLTGQVPQAGEVTSQGD